MTVEPGRAEPAHGVAGASGVLPTPTRFAPGSRTVLRRYWRGRRVSFMNVTRVIADDERGLRLFIPVGAPWWRIVAPDGRTHHDAPIDELGPDAYLRESVWQGNNVLIWMPAGQVHLPEASGRLTAGSAPLRPLAGRSYSVWWFFDGQTGDFAGWYGNLEEPYVRWDDGVAAGVDTADHALDLRVRPDGSWEWKDPEEFAARTGHPLYWSLAEAAEIRAEGERLAKLAESRAFPFDGTWCDFHPDPMWPLPQRPTGWDRPRA